MKFLPFLLSFLTLSAFAEEREDTYYRIVNLPTPVATSPGGNAPEPVMMEAGGLCFLGPDKLACSSRIGDIWIAEGVLGENPQPKWTLFASGLHEVLGLATRPNDKEGWLYCTQRCEVTRIRDTNGDGRADLFETVSDPWGLDGDYHEYAFGSKFDKDGNMYVGLCLTGSFTSENPYRGWCLKITPDGKTIPVCTGIRSPGGIGFNAAGDLFYTDNQGDWNSTCKLQQILPGRFVGHPAGLKWFDEPETKDAIAAAGLKKSAEPESGGRLYLEAQRIPEILAPAVYFPYPRMGQSTAGFVPDLTGGKFGPFKNQLFVSDQSHAMISRVFLEKVDGNYQGACFPFRRDFSSGVLSVEFAPDGSLFAYGTDRGWAGSGSKPYALQRLEWTGQTPFEVLEMKVQPDGFMLNFTAPVDEATAQNPASYSMESFNYIYQKSYGSPEVDRASNPVLSAQVSVDKMSVRLEIAGLRPGFVHTLKLPGVRSAGGRPLLHNTADYTLFHLPSR